MERRSLEDERLRASRAVRRPHAHFLANSTPVDRREIAANWRRACRRTEGTGRAAAAGYKRHRGDWVCRRLPQRRRHRRSALAAACSRRQWRPTRRCRSAAVAAVAVARRRRGMAAIFFHCRRQRRRQRRRRRLPPRATTASSCRRVPSSERDADEARRCADGQDGNRIGSAAMTRRPLQRRAQRAQTLNNKRTLQMMMTLEETTRTRQITRCTNAANVGVRANEPTTAATARARCLLLRRPTV